MIARSLERRKSSFVAVVQFGAGNHEQLSMRLWLSA